MHTVNYAGLDEQTLTELLLVAEDRLELTAAREIAARAEMTEVLSQLLVDKHNWLAELPEWWAVVHAAFIMGYKGGSQAIAPLLASLRWADAFDCDWVTEALPSIFGKIGVEAIPGLRMVALDKTAGWSARNIALQSLAAISINHPAQDEAVFRLIGDIFMDENEDRLLRQLAGIILLDFRRESYRLALVKFSKEEWMVKDLDYYYALGFSSEDVDFVFHQLEPFTWFYQEDWMRFYQPAEIQRRQKRWSKERLSSARRPHPPGGGGRVLSLWRPSDLKPEQE